MKAIITRDFAADIEVIDKALKGRLNQDTWQTEAISHGGNEYIVHHEVIADVFPERKVHDIDLNEGIEL